MIVRSPRRGFDARPGDLDASVQTSEPSAVCPLSAEFSAAHAIDGTPMPRGRIKAPAFRHGPTVADMLCDPLGREFPEDLGATP